MREITFEKEKMKTKLISLLIISAALVCNAAFAESGYIQHVRKNAEAGQAWAEKALGDAFYFGIDMEADYEKAFEWYRKAAKQGDSTAMHAVGRSYYFGEGAEKNYKKAAEWYSKASDACDKVAEVCNKAAESCESDAESCKSDAEACGVAIDAIGACNAKSWYSLAQMYEHGRGVKKDITKAEEMYLQGIYDHLNTNLFYSLAQMYLENDQHSPKVHPLKLLHLAYHLNGNTAAGHAIDSIDFGVSPAQFKQIWEAAETEYGGFSEVEYDIVTENALSNISVRIAVAESPIESLSADEVYDRVWRSVVYIHIDGVFNGSGVIVQPDIVATNCHVVGEGGQILVYQSKEQSGRENIPYIVRRSPITSEGRDYCLLHVPGLPGSGVPATIRPYNTLEIGETVYALGAPVGEILSFSKGIISQKRDEWDYTYPDEAYAPARAIQSDVDFAPGSSGGGLFDSAGNLIGHTTASITAEEGLKFSIPADIVLQFE